MEEEAAATPDRGQELYTARFPTGVRVAYWIPVGFGCAVLVLMIVSVAALAISGAPSWPVVVLILAVALLALAVPTALLLYNHRGTGMRMTLTSTGVEVRNLARHWIPWEDVALVEPSRNWFWWDCATFRLHSGDQVRAKITADRFILMRGEPMPRLDERAPSRPTLIAIDAHRRFLRGEFSAAAPHDREGTR